MNDEELFLISMTPDDTGRAANYLVKVVEWRQLLDTARRNGWTPAGTVLDVEFQFGAALAAYDVEVTEEFERSLMVDVRQVCSRWQGGYFSGDYQLVTSGDARNLAAALEGAAVPEELLQFLTLGGFRIGR